MSKTTRACEFGKKLSLRFACFLAVFLFFLTMTPRRSYGAPAPLSFSTTTLDGKPYSSEVFRNYDLIMVNMWAEWCWPCVSEMPDLERIHKNYPRVLLLGAWNGSSVDAAIQTVNNMNPSITYPLIQSPYTMYDYIIMEGGSFSIPQTCFFDRSGNQLGTAYVGSRDYDSWAGIVNEMLSKVQSSGNTGAEKPVITSQPKAAKVKAGKKVTFKVAAKGSDLTYQWYYRKSAGAKWKKVSKKGTSAVYSFTAKKKMSGYRYRCLIKNAGGKVYSKSVKLTVKK